MSDPQDAGATPPSYSPPPTSSDAPAYPQTPQPYAQQGQGYPQAPEYNPAYSGVPPTVPGKTLGLVAFIGSLVIAPLSILWLILGIVARVQSNKVGYKNGFALAAIIISIVAFIATVIVVIFSVIAVTAGIAYLNEVCGTNGPGQFVQDGVTYTCP